MTEQPTPLDPDEVECPRCPANAGDVCLTPSGGKSRTVHIARRRAAAAGRRHRPQAAQPNRNPRKSPGTLEGRRKGQATQAQNRARRKKEAEALAQQQLAELEEQALASEVEKLAADTVRYSRDRLLVRRDVLNAAQAAHERLLESLAYLKRPKGYDVDGKPLTVPVELYGTVRGRRVRVENEDGTPAVRDEAELIGHWTVAQVESLAKSAAATLNSLRLEEGKPTGIFERQGSGGAAEALGEAGIEELLKLAAETLPREGQTGGDG